MTRLIIANEGDDVRGLFWSCSCVPGRWWLSDIGSSRRADEEFSLSSLTQGYGSILLSTLFLLRHKAIPLSLRSTSILSPTLVAVIRLGLLGIVGLFFLFLNFCLSFAFWLHPAVSFLYLAPSGPAHIEASTIRIVLSHAIFLLSHKREWNTVVEAVVVLISQPHAKEESPTQLKAKFLSLNLH